LDGWFAVCRLWSAVEIVGGCVVSCEQVLLGDERGIVGGRVASQGLAERGWEQVEGVVSYFGAMQAQEFLEALWSVGQRTPGLAEAEVEQAFAEGHILRTHVMRPTWHFVAAEDIRWLLELTADRVHTTIGSYYRKLELDDTVFGKANEALAEALQGGNELTRAEVRDVLEAAGIEDTKDRLRSNFVIMHAELDGVICSGARRGKQHTYALLEERAPQAKRLERDEALAELTRRYFRSHGPATLKDYRWWSGLLAVDAQAGVDMLGSELVCEEIDGETYWFASDLEPVVDGGPRVSLLPTFDEYLVGYTERNAALGPEDKEWPIDLSCQTITLDGRITGTWKRKLLKNTVEMTLDLFRPLPPAAQEALTSELEAYGAFLQKEVVGVGEP
jgi:hypothetical protein